MIQLFSILMGKGDAAPEQVRDDKESGMTSPKSYLKGRLHCSQ